MVRPVNSEICVENFFKLFKDNNKIELLPTTIINVTLYSNDMPVPHNLRKPCSLYQCAKYYWDLNVNISYILMAINKSADNNNYIDDTQ